MHARYHAVATATFILALLACASPAALAQAPSAAGTKNVNKAQVAATTPAADAELLLRGCAGEAHRNAKLYVARAHGIELTKRSADRNQGRSMLRIEAQLDGTLAQLRGKSEGVDADLARMEETLIGLTELTLQQPQVAQVEAALRLAERAATACDAALQSPGDNPRGKIKDVGRASELMFEVIDAQMRRSRRRA